ncbi:response regulator [Pedobacter psychrodurus]|uniref:response regulator n=1 Tax=Pedobacter psychrodurus TaxID=2530456 RepID=UPI00292E044C|nr:response regulator [Pedobacter psychrodurus]
MKHKKILVIDTEVTMLNLLGLMLGDRYNVSMQSGPIEAIQWLQKGNMPDMIISEFNMPYMSGPDLITNLKISGLYRHIPIIILSGIKDLSAQISTIPFKVDAYFSKPFNPFELEKAMCSILDNHAIN